MAFRAERSDEPGRGPARRWLSADGYLKEMTVLPEPLTWLIAVFYIGGACWIVYQQRRIDQLLAERRQIEAQLRLQARTDALTGLHNRQGFQEIYGREVARANRNGQPFGLLMIDLDGLKRINDTWGHLAGDEALQLVGSALSRSIRSSDVAARCGGDEFVILLPETDAAGARVVVEKIRAALAAANREARCPGRVEVSIGIGSGPAWQDLVSQADEAMYRDKRNRASRGTASALPLA